MNHRLPPLLALRAFEAAARLGRMTAAAVELSVTPGAVSRQVRQLEDHLGLALFDGSKARPTLTAAGQALQPVLTSAFAQIRDAVRALGDAGRGPLDIACYSTFTVKWLIPRLFDFHARHPDIEVRLRTTDTGADAALAGCDLIITAEDTATPDDPASDQILFRESLGPVMAPGLAPLTGPASDLDLSRLPLLHTRSRRDAWRQWAASAGQPPKRENATDPVYEHYFFTLEAAVRGLGVAVAPWHLVADEVRAGRLIAPFGFVESGYRYLARHRAESTNPRLSVFCEWLSEQARAQALPPSTAEGLPTLTPAP